MPAGDPRWPAHFWSAGAGLPSRTRPDPPIEETFPFTGQAELFDLEEGLTLRVGDAGKWGEDYRERLQAHRDAIREACRHAGWTLTLHRTDRPASEGVLRIASLIAASRGGPAG